jgi:hypothetical protein
LVAGNLSEKPGHSNVYPLQGWKNYRTVLSQKIFDFPENDIFCVCFDVIYSGENNVFDVTLSVYPQQKIFLQKREKR